VKKLLEKNRTKRPSLEETLQHPWFADYKDIQSVRKAASKSGNGLDNKFEAFTIMQPNSPKMSEDLKAIQDERK
jgi:serine/threonine protein kinase